MADGPRDAPCSDQTTKIPDKLKYYRARPHPVCSGAENQRTVRNFGLLPREVPPQPEGVQNPTSASPSCHGRFDPAATPGHWAFTQHPSYRHYQLAGVPHPVSPTRANNQDSGCFPQ